MSVDLELRFNVYAFFGSRIVSARWGDRIFDLLEEFSIKICNLQ